MIKTFVPLAFACVFVGILLIFENFGYIGSISLWWPLFPFLVGIGMAVSFFEHGQRELVIIGMATYILVASIFFLYLNFVGWITLKEYWPFFIGFLGLSFVSVIYFGGKRKIYKFLSFFLILLSLLLFLIFKVDSRLWPLSLVLFGISVLLIS